MCFQLHVSLKRKSHKHVHVHKHLHVCTHSLTRSHTIHNSTNKEKPFCRLWEVIKFPNVYFKLLCLFMIVCHIQTEHCTFHSLFQYIFSLCQAILKYQSTGGLGCKYWVIEVYLTGNYMLNLV